jgi:hypothetical protein
MMTALTTCFPHSEPSIMPDNQDASDKKSAATQSDNEKELQDELRREAAEGKGAVGDAAANRNLSGSSTWETLPDDSAKGGSASGESK